MTDGITGLGDEEEEEPFKPQWQGGIPWQYIMGPYGPQMQPIPRAYQYQPGSPYEEMLRRFSQFSAFSPLLQNLVGTTGQAFAQAYPQQFGMQPLYDYPGVGGAGGAMRYDPFSQQLQAAQFQELMRQFQVTSGLDRSRFLSDVLSTPSNVFSSFFQARGQVPPYNAQLANILNIPGQGSPWFGALPPMGPTPGMPAVPTPQPPQAIPYAQGGTYIPPEPAVAIGLLTGRPLFTFNEQAPAKTEKVKITPQNKGKALEGEYIPPGVPSFQAGGTALPAPLEDVFQRGFPRFPFLESLGRGEALGYPQMGKAIYGFPLPSPQALGRMTPSEGASMMDMFNTVFGVPAEDVLWASLLPFQGLRRPTPAMRRIG